ncbi:MAG: bifunctional riboflavin kinase/FAD synthetase [Rickettsiales bacterium]|nr:bifunctional riboflavin kinase/FAD synthetase [Rickettsiales bacterium]
MRLIRSPQANRKTNQNLPALSATIGNFEGIHLGHEKLIHNTIKKAKEQNLQSAIITFEPHPASYFAKDQNKNIKIFSLSQKLKLLKEKYQIDYVIILNFNTKFANIEPTDFIEETLIKNLNIKHLTIGYDFTFGHNKSGNAALLQKYFQHNLDQIKKVEINNQICSSSNIRQSIQEGNIKKANQLLNKNYSISGIISSNNKLGQTIGFKTANLILNNHCIKPKFGVYKTLTTIHHLGKTLPSITNFGIRPTVENSKKEIFETHILHFDHNIYNQKITVEFLDFIRDEKRFNNIDELKKQIKNDITKINL